MARWDEARVAQLRKMWEQGVHVDHMAQHFGTSRGAIYVMLQKLDLPTRIKKGSRRKADSTGQRRFHGVELSGEGHDRTPSPHHPALRNGSTIYGRQVIPAIEHQRILKSGRENRKIGTMAVKGRWKGMPIYTLTLEERATCPRSCAQWANCYGNNMGLAPRVLDDGWLQIRLWIELHQLNAIHEQGFIVRLHVLGDFFSRDYVQFWCDALAVFTGLRIFGFTARKPDTDIGRAVVLMMERYVERVAMRWSGIDLPLHTSEVVTDRASAKGIVCPAQLDASRSCATCGLCWQSERMITFLEH